MDTILYMYSPQFAKEMCDALVGAGYTAKLLPNGVEIFTSATKGDLLNASLLGAENGVYSVNAPITDAAGIGISEIAG